MHLQKIYKIARALVIGLLLLSMLAACTPVGPTPPAADAITLTDALGRTVSVPKNPRRVAALLGSFADAWVLAGGAPIAAANDAWEDFGLELSGAVNLGGAHSPSTEALLAANPDLVLASASTASNVAMLDILEATGIPVLYFDVDNFEDYLAMLDVCTRLTGRRDLYEQNGTAICAAVEAVKASYTDAALPDEERTVLLLRASSTAVKAKGSRGTVLGEMLADMGCINVADSDTGLLENLSMEAMIRANPRHIFVVTMGNDPTAAANALQQFMEENPAWETLDAVREGRVHVMDRALFNLKPNARWGIAYEELYKTLVNS